MRSVALHTLGLVFMGSLLSALMGAQQIAAPANQSLSLGDLGRQQRAAHRQKPAKIFTNDDLPAVAFNNGAVISDASTATSPPSNADHKAPNSSGKSASLKSANNASNEKSGSSDLEKPDEQFRAQFEEKKKAAALLQREFDVSQREYQLQSAAAYEDAGTRLRNPEKWAEEHQKHEDEMAEKQQELDQAKQSLEDLKEQGRKAGVSPRVFGD